VLPLGLAFGQPGSEVIARLGEPTLPREVNPAVDLLAGHA
jgi:hypothetical protein